MDPLSWNGTDTAKPWLKRLRIPTAIRWAARLWVIRRIIRAMPKILSIAFGPVGRSLHKASEIRSRIHWDFLPLLSVASLRNAVLQI
jgi:hypothetical protein